MGKNPSVLPLLQTQVFPGSWKFPSQPISCFAAQWDGYSSSGCGSPASPSPRGSRGLFGARSWARSAGAGGGREPGSCQKKLMRGGERRGKIKKKINKKRGEQRASLRAAGWFSCGCSQRNVMYRHRPRSHLPSPAPLAAGHGPSAATAPRHALASLPGQAARREGPLPAPRMLHPSNTLCHLFPPGAPKGR